MHVCFTLRDNPRYFYFSGEEPKFVLLSNTQGQSHGELNFLDTDEITFLDQRFKLSGSLAYYVDASF